MIKIENKVNCCGCYGCYNICPTNAIEMIEDEKGFKYPKINQEKCINCGLCEKVCPNINNKTKSEVEIQAYACINKDISTRMNSSSGGIFSIIANYILELNGVVFGVTFDEEYKVMHSYIENKEELSKFQGSKYVQSQIGDTYKKVKEFLEKDRYVLFTGTPCQVEGIYKYLGKQYDKLYTQDIICHGVPSPKVWKKYLNEKSLEYKGILKKVSFRDKNKTGWQDFAMKLEYNDMVYNLNHNQDIYMRAFLSDICLRDSCYACNFKKKNRISDITLADFWGINELDKTFNDNKGTSLVIVNSNKGKNLFDDIKENIIYKEFNFLEAIKYNPSMIYSSKMNKNREKFFAELDDKKLEDLLKKYTKKPLHKKVLGKIKKSIKRIIVK